MAKFHSSRMQPNGLQHKIDVTKLTHHKNAKDGVIKLRKAHYTLKITARIEEDEESRKIVNS